MTMKKTAVIVAGGSGVRMGTAVPKQFLHLKGKPIIWHTVQQFFYAYYDIQIVLVLPASYIGEAATYFETAQLAHIQFVEGGATRFESVKNDPVSVKKIGIDIATQMGAQLLDLGVPGLHFYTMNTAESTIEIAKNLGLVKS